MKEKETIIEREDENSVVIREKRYWGDWRIPVDTVSSEYWKFNFLEVQAGTNGFQGGDSGHGSRAYLRIQDLASTDIRIFPHKTGGEYDGVEIVVGGDSEIETLAKALRFAADAIRDMALGKVNDLDYIPDVDDIERNVYEGWGEEYFEEDEDEENFDEDEDEEREDDEESDGKEDDDDGK